jgi:hypothetical protein
MNGISILGFRGPPKYTGIRPVCNKEKLVVLVPGEGKQ